MLCRILQAQGELGYGDRVDRGNAANQMGDDLAFVDLGFTVIAAPTSFPTMTCDESEMYDVNWNDLVRHILYTLSLSLYSPSTAHFPN